MEFPLSSPATSSIIYEVSCWKCSVINEVGSTMVKIKDTDTASNTNNPQSANTSSSRDNTKKTTTNAKSFGFTGKTGTDDNPVELEYYNILGVDAKATPAQIKKAYYQMAMKAHPDKNRNDPEADEKFKKVSQAYQVLFDPQRRSHYNQYGKAAPGAEAVFVDPEEFFKQQFGGDKFVEIIGEISIAKDFKEAMGMMSQQGGENGTVKQTDPNMSSMLQGGGLSLEERTTIREARVNRLVFNLLEKLSLYTDAWPLPGAVNGEVPIGASESQLAQEALDTFRAICFLEAETLKTESYGVELLNAIGYVYAAKADQWLSRLDTEEGHLFKKVWGFGNRLTSFAAEKSHILKETVGTFRTALDLQSSFAKLQDMEKKKEERKTTRTVEGSMSDDSQIQNDDEDDDGLTLDERDLKSKLEYEAATKGLETLWRGSKLEVEAVLREVCDRVLGDENVSSTMRRRRAEGLKALGKVFKSAKKEDAESVRSNIGLGGTT
ncbi:hypothetical protein SeMB42_g07552 [Synchytrium endobioticum]|nr:hypothetical protein SeMB42_g07552 [Synchytrium endobioticum]